MMAGIVFFPGWPKMKGFVELFLIELNSKIEKEEIELDRDGLVLVSYSAGVINLLDFFEKKEAKIKKIILIAPAGLTNRGFLRHCASFVRELYNSDLGLPKKKKILGECVYLFLKNPWKFWWEIRKIRKYNLIEELKKRDIKEVDLIISPEDMFINPKKGLVKINKNFDISFNMSPGGHFGILTEPKTYSQIVNEKMKKTTS